jgi:hypothetical protein
MIFATLATFIAAALPAVDRTILPELSGLAAGHAHPEVLWAHNDSDNPAEVFALDRNGTLLARFNVAARNVDWEDIACDARGIYLADVGDNARQRTTIDVYRIAEPDPAKPAIAPLPPEKQWTLTYPDGPHNCEALCLRGDQAWLIEKSVGHARVYAFDLAGAAQQQLTQTGDLIGVGPVLGADINADGTLLAIANPFGIAILPLGPGGPNADPLHSEMIPISMDVRREAVAFTPDGGVVCGSESGGWWTLPAARIHAR